MEKNKQNINSLPEKEFNDLAWANMLETLDKEMPVEKKRGIIGYWFWPLAALLLLAVGLFVLLPNENDLRGEAAFRTATDGENTADEIQNADVNEKDKNDNAINPKDGAQSAFDQWTKPAIITSENQSEGKTSGKNQAENTSKNKLPPSPKMSIAPSNPLWTGNKGTAAYNSSSPTIVEIPFIPKKIKTTDINLLEKDVKGEMTGKEALPSRPSRTNFTTEEIARKTSLLDKKVAEPDPVLSLKNKPKLAWGLQARLLAATNLESSRYLGTSLGLSLRKKRWGLESELAMGLVIPISTIPDTIIFEPQCQTSSSCGYTLIETKKESSYFFRTALFGSYAVNRHLELFVGPDLLLQSLKFKNINSIYESVNNSDALVSSSEEKTQNNNIGGNFGLRFTPKFPIGFDLRYRQGYEFPKLQGINANDSQFQLNHLLELGLVIKFK